uniref:Uncharacterized protein n=1 Tax=Sphaerodactylus townsendi TaxID=933632 RepID=A0ACB8FT62_9SAUR
MFGKKKKRIEISAPSNFEHRVHTGYDQQEQKFTGLPRQWQGIIEESAKRPKPLVDPVYITAVQPGSQKMQPSGKWSLSPHEKELLLLTRQKHALLIQVQAWQLLWVLIHNEMESAPPECL